MKNKPMVMDQGNRSNNLDWLYQEEDEDFLMGKTPIEIPDICEDEE